MITGEEEKSRELSLLSEELTKHYKHHIEQLEHKLQLAMESSDVTADETNLSRYKAQIEMNARTQVEQYYQECREEVEKLQEEITELAEERDQVHTRNYLGAPHTPKGVHFRRNLSFGVRNLRSSPCK